MRVTSKGQVTIPKKVRELVGMPPGTDVEFSVVGGEVRVCRSAHQPAGRELVERLRRGRADFSMTTEEIMALTRGEDRRGLHED